MEGYEPTSSDGSLETGLYNIDWIYNRVAEKGTAFGPDPANPEVVASVFGNMVFNAWTRVGGDPLEASLRFVEGCAILGVDKEIMKKALMLAEPNPQVAPSSEVILSELDDFLARFTLAP